MAKAIRVSDQLYRLAQLEAVLENRSLAQQIEYWAKLGMAAAARRVGEEQAQYGVSPLDAAIEATRRADILEVTEGRRSPDYTYAIPRSVARRSKAAFRIEDP